MTNNVWHIAFVVLVMLVVAADINEVYAFLAPTQRIIHTKSNVCSQRTSTTSLYKRKPSMKERRRQRAKKQPSVKVDRGILNDLPPVDAWEKTQPAAADVQSASPAEVKKVKVVTGDVDEIEAEETKAKASALVESQRKSVDCLTFIRKRVEESAFPFNDAAKSILDKGYFVYDNFLSSNEDEAFGDALLDDMLQECSDMLSNDKLERDITRLRDGEYLTKIVGGDAYADCPRLTEYVVSLTRHLPPLFNKELDVLEDDNMSRLDGTASMGTLRVYNRQTRLSEESLLKKDAESDESNNQNKPFGVICGESEGTENDTRRLTAMLFLSSKDWDARSCGGGVTMAKGEEKVDAIRDRIILLRSDTCSYRQEPWIGDDKEGLGLASCAIVHFVKETK